MKVICSLLLIASLWWACSAPSQENKAQKTSQVQGTGKARVGKDSQNAGKTNENTTEKIASNKIRIDTVGKYTAEDSIALALYEPIKSGLWDTLRDIKYEKEGVYGHVPLFTPKHKPLHGKYVRIEGYMHPIEATDLQKWFMLSYFPSSSCFFCGAAGPETAIEVKSPKGVMYKRDKRITLRGKLFLNYDEPERLFYILEEATQE